MSPDVLVAAGGELRYVGYEELDQETLGEADRRILERFLGATATAPATSS